MKYILVGMLLSNMCFAEIIIICTPEEGCKPVIIVR